jgi:hypothetical protein
MTETITAPRAAPHPAGTKTSTKVVSDWTALMPGDLVTVLEEYSVPHSGWIDDVTEDGMIIWLLLAFGRGRRMFFREDGVLITVEVPHTGP